mmetsp:Transcript_37299/g.87015  ORF Transcript_37299/g.87015 Transcript_37299/m.87015 type:complete len:105 (+) Transcript_37299:1131-1445(+)
MNRKYRLIKVKKRQRISFFHRLDKLTAAIHYSPYRIFQTTKYRYSPVISSIWEASAILDCEEITSQQQLPSSSCSCLLVTTTRIPTAWPEPVASSSGVSSPHAL